MAVLLVILATVTAVVIGRPESKDELAPPERTTTRCPITIKMRYDNKDGKPPYPVCSSQCFSGEELWIDGVVFKRLPELEEYELMVEIIYINGTLRDCRMVPYETGEQTTARQEARKRSMDSCSSIEKGSQDETLVLSHTERIPISIPIHKRLEGFSRVGNSYYIVSPEVMAYHEAGPYCESLGATLASVESSRELNLLQGILATGVWRARNDDIWVDGDILVEISDTPSNALCEHPVVDDSNQYSCPDGYWKYKSSCYVRANVSSSYSDGEKFCSARGAYPVFINSQEESDFLARCAQKWGELKRRWGFPPPAPPKRPAALETGKFETFSFIGYTDLVEEGKFVSKRFGFPFFTRWIPGEPDDEGGKEDCVAIYPDHSMSWNDVPCGWAVKMVCEMSAEIVD